MAVNVTRDEVLEELKQLATQLNGILKNLRDLLGKTANLKSFVDAEFEGQYRFNATMAFSDCYSALAVSSRAEVDDIVGIHSRDEEIRDAYEELVAEEESWKRFVDEMQAKFSEEIRTTEAVKDVKALTDMQLGWRFVDFESKRDLTLADIIQPTPYTLFAFFRQMG